LIPSASESATVRALTFTVVYEVGQAALAKLTQDRPSIVDEIKQTLSQRAKAGASGATGDHGVADVPSISGLASRIRRIFSEGPHGSAMR
jgi:CRP-like cAMP-binding protein